MLRGVALVLLLLLTGCGRVGDPLPPFIRIPEPVRDLAVVQSGYDLILTWTNPARYIDGSAATDLQGGLVFSDGNQAVAVQVIAPGGVQSVSIPARALIGRSMTFSVQIETNAQKRSAISNPVSITVVDVPGAVTRLRAVVDQNRITLDWNPPDDNTSLANVYIVSEEGGDTSRVTDAKFVDEEYETGQMYTYAVTAARQTGSMEIPGMRGVVMITAIDTTAPQVPTGLEGIASGDGGFVTWAANEETDLAGYRVFRSDRPDSGFVPLSEELRVPNQVFDPSYRTGLYYAVSAIDESGNESARSAPYRAP